jgi:two-component system phosphate regulon response regulator OmpR
MNRVLQREAIDLLVLDVMMPGENGMDVCKRLRAAGQKLPIIMLTAQGSDADRIAGLDLGADDYLGKPFNPRELLARIHAVLRRRPAHEMGGAPSQDEQSIEFGECFLDLGLRSLRRNGIEVPLTTTEFAILKTLVKYAKTPLSRERLAQLAQGRELEANDRSLDVQISRLRKLIEIDSGNPKHLQTVWGMGYVFVPSTAA